MCHCGRKNFFIAFRRILYENYIVSRYGCWEYLCNPQQNVTAVNHRKKENTYESCKFNKSREKDICIRIYKLSFIVNVLEI